jgi:uncharacterized protein
VIIVDLNILIYATNSATPHHAAIVRWWHELLNANEPIGLPWIVTSGFVRLTTRGGILPRPLPIETALKLVDEWLGLDLVLVPRETDNHWSIQRRLLLASGTGGNLVTDAHLAALAIGNGATLATCDRDFARFDGLRTTSPLDHL